MSELLKTRLKKAINARQGMFARPVVSTPALMRWVRYQRFGTSEQELAEILTELGGVFLGEFTSGDKMVPYWALKDQMDFWARLSANAPGVIQQWLNVTERTPEC